MELRQLRYFAAVADCGGFSRAAEQLHIAQPAVSAQIRQLERELGVTLLARTTRRVALTQAGELFLSRTRRALDELAGAQRDLAELNAVLRGRVTLGVTSVLGGIDLPALLADFTTRYPGVTLTLRSGLIADLLAALDAADADLVLGPIHDDLPPRYTAYRLVDEQLVLITPPGHQLSGRPTVSLADVAKETFACLPAGSGLRAILDAAATAVGFRPHVQLEASSPDSIRALVSAGLAVAVLAASVAYQSGPPVNVHDLQPTPPHPPIGLIHRPDLPRTPAIDALRHDLLEAAVRRSPPA